MTEAIKEGGGEEQKQLISFFAKSLPKSWFIWMERSGVHNLKQAASMFSFRSDFTGPGYVQNDFGANL